jgi:isoleucyl-tRNA synthetase
MAPILSFTAEEVWEVLSGKEDDSVFASDWYELPLLGNRVEIFTRWQKLREIRATVQRFLETLRMEGKIGSSLQAEVEVGVDGITYDALKDIGDELRFILVTSQANFYTIAELDSSSSAVSAVASQRQKCERCWHYRADVGADAQHATLCGRCISNLYGTGEARRYA